MRLSNYGAPSKLFHAKEEVKAIVEELEGLRGKKWRQADLRMRCYATVQLLNGEKLVTLLAECMAGTVTLQLSLFGVVQILFRR